MSGLYAFFPSPDLQLSLSLPAYSLLMGIEDRETFFYDRKYIDDYLIMYVINGVLFCESENRHMEITSGEYVFIDLHRPHKYYFKKGCPTCIYWIHLNGEFVSSLTKRIDGIYPLPIIGCGDDVLNDIKIAFELNAGKNANLFMLSAHIVSLLTKLYYKCYLGQLRQRSPDELEFRQKIDIIFSSVPYINITLDFLCESMHLNKYYFSHKFKEFFGISPMKYVTNKKIMYAQNLLKYSNEKLYIIAELSGFSSLSYFSYVFKKETGINPNEYRNAQ